MSRLLTGVVIAVALLATASAAARNGILDTSSRLASADPLLLQMAQPVARVQRRYWNAPSVETTSQGLRVGDIPVFSLGPQIPTTDDAHIVLTHDTLVVPFGEPGQLTVSNAVVDQGAIAASLVASTPQDTESDDLLMATIGQCAQFMVHFDGAYTRAQVAALLDPLVALNHELFSHFTTEHQGLAAFVSGEFARQYLYMPFQTIAVSSHPVAMDRWVRQMAAQGVTAETTAASSVDFITGVLPQMKVSPRPAVADLVAQSMVAQAPEHLEAVSLYSHGLDLFHTVSTQSYNAEAAQDAPILVGLEATVTLLPGFSQLPVDSVQQHMVPLLRAAFQSALPENGPQETLFVNVASAQNPRVIRVALAASVPVSRHQHLGQVRAEVAERFHLGSVALARVASVQSVAGKLPTSVYNDDATWILESGVRNERPYFAKGITGEGQLVGVGDSGCDYSHCMLQDFQQQVPKTCESGCHFKDMFVDPDCYELFLRFNFPCETKALTCDFSGSDCSELSQHRKVPMYWGFVDNEDVVNGHGTHVSGSVAAQPETFNASIHSISHYRGSGTGARLVFADLGTVLNERAIFSPPDLNTDYFPQPYALGAKLHTNSWGGWSQAEHSVYSDNAQQIDTFSHDHQDFLVLFAAGNQGRIDWSSVGVQATMKNGVTVGASRTSSQHFLEECVNFDTAENFGQIAGAVCNADFWNQVPSGQDKKLCELFIADDDSNYKTCEEVQQWFCSNITSKKEGFCCELDTVAAWKTYVRASCCKATYTQMYQAQADAGVMDMWTPADFTSRGPVMDGRMKPDLMAPGDAILSTRADGNAADHQCDPDPYSVLPGLYKMSGTSMATPHTTGTSAKVREYYEKGFYHCAAMPCSTKHAPSAALVKATLINSAIPQFGHKIDDAVIGSVRTLTKAGGDQFITGHGLVRLSQALELPGDLTSKVKLVFWDVSDANGLGQGDSAKYTFDVPAEAAGAGMALSVTLAYTDPPSALTAGVNLVSDLDLEVQTPDCLTFTGNEYLELDKVSQVGQFQINAYPLRNGRFYDHRNNLERVLIATPRPGTYTVRVLGRSVPTKDQQGYALVVNYGVPKAFTGPASPKSPTLALSDAPQVCPDPAYAPKNGKAPAEKVSVTLKGAAASTTTTTTAATTTASAVGATPAETANQLLDQLAEKLYVARTRLVLNDAEAKEADVAVTFTINSPKRFSNNADAFQPSSAYLATVITQMVTDPNNQALSGGTGADIDASSIQVQEVKTGGGGGDDDSGIGTGTTVLIILLVLLVVAVIVGLVVWRRRVAKRASEDRYFMSMGDEDGVDSSVNSAYSAPSFPNMDQAL